MPPVIKGINVINALNELKSPSNLNDIVDHMSVKYKASKTILSAAVKSILEAGVQCGFIQETEDKYFTDYVFSEEAKDNQIEANQNEPEHQESTKSVEASQYKEIAVKDNKRHTISKRPFVSYSSDEDEMEREELHDQGDCCGSRYSRRRSSRSRSRSRHGKSHSRRRTRRRRRE